MDCPICGRTFPRRTIDVHVNICLDRQNNNTENYTAAARVTPSSSASSSSSSTISRSSSNTTSIANGTSNNRSTNRSNFHSSVPFARSYGTASASVPSILTDPDMPGLMTELALHRQFVTLESTYSTHTFDKYTMLKNNNSSNDQYPSKYTTGTTKNPNLSLGGENKSSTLRSFLTTTSSSATSSSNPPPPHRDLRFARTGSLPSPTYAVNNLPLGGKLYISLGNVRRKLVYTDIYHENNAKNNDSIVFSTTALYSSTTPSVVQTTPIKRSKKVEKLSFTTFSTVSPILQMQSSPSKLDSPSSVSSSPSNSPSVSSSSSSFITLSLDSPSRSVTVPEKLSFSSSSSSVSSVLHMMKEQTCHVAITVDNEQCVTPTVVIPKDTGTGSFQNYDQVMDITEYSANTPINFQLYIPSVSHTNASLSLSRFSSLSSPSSSSLSSAGCIGTVQCTLQDAISMHSRTSLSTAVTETNRRNDKSSISSPSFSSAPSSPTVLHRHGHFTEADGPLQLRMQLQSKTNNNNDDKAAPSIEVIPPFYGWLGLRSHTLSFTVPLHTENRRSSKNFHSSTSGTSPSVSSSSSSSIPASVASSTSTSPSIWHRFFACFLPRSIPPPLSLKTVESIHTMNPVYGTLLYEIDIQMVYIPMADIKGPRSLAPSWSPLHRAVADGNITLVRSLVNATSRDWLLHRTKPEPITVTPTETLSLSPTVPPSITSVDITLGHLSVVDIAILTRRKQILNSICTALSSLVAFTPRVSIGIAFHALHYSALMGDAAGIGRVILLVLNNTKNSRRSGLSSSLSETASSHRQALYTAMRELGLSVPTEVDRTDEQAVLAMVQRWNRSTTGLFSDTERVESSSSSSSLSLSLSLSFSRSLLSYSKGNVTLRNIPTETLDRVTGSSINLHNYMGSSFGIDNNESKIPEHDNSSHLSLNTSRSFFAGHQRISGSVPGPVVRKVPSLQQPLESFISSAVNIPYSLLSLLSLFTLPVLMKETVVSSSSTSMGTVSSASVLDIARSNRLLMNRPLGNGILDILTHNGWTPLIIAIHSGDIHCIRVLLLGGALPQICDTEGNTPFMHACRLGRLDIAAYLLLKLHPESFSTYNNNNNNLSSSSSSSSHTTSHRTRPNGGLHSLSTDTTDNILPSQLLALASPTVHNLTFANEFRQAHNLPSITNINKTPNNLPNQTMIDYAEDIGWQCVRTELPYPEEFLSPSHRQSLNSLNFPYIGTAHYPLRINYNESENDSVEKMLDRLQLSMESFRGIKIYVENSIEHFTPASLRNRIGHARPAMINHYDESAFHILVKATIRAYQEQTKSESGPIMMPPNNETGVTYCSCGTCYLTSRCVSTSSFPAVSQALSSAYTALPKSSIHKASDGFSYHPPTWIDLVRTIIDSGSPVRNYVFPEDRSLPLHKAVEANHLCLIRVLTLTDNPTIYRTVLALGDILVQTFGTSYSSQLSSTVSKSSSSTSIVTTEQRDHFTRLQQILRDKYRYSDDYLYQVSVYTGILPMPAINSSSAVASSLGGGTAPPRWIQEVIDNNISLGDDGRGIFYDRFIERTRILVTNRIGLTVLDIAEQNLQRYVSVGTNSTTDTALSLKYRYAFTIFTLLRTLAFLEYLTPCILEQQQYVPPVLLSSDSSASSTVPMVPEENTEIPEIYNYYDEIAAVEEAMNTYEK